MSREDYELISGTPWNDDDFSGKHLDPDELNDIEDDDEPELF